MPGRGSASGRPAAARRRRAGELIFACRRRIRRLSGSTAENDLLRAECRRAAQQRYDEILFHGFPPFRDRMRIVSSAGDPSSNIIHQKTNFSVRVFMKNKKFIIFLRMNATDRIALPRHASDDLLSVP
jgi:hypothetical protein